MTSERNSRKLPDRRQPGDRFGITEMLMLVAGIAIGFWVMRPLILQEYDSENGDPIQMVPIFLRVIIVVLGGIWFIGVPLLLIRRRSDRIPWGPGKTAWFTHGTASWLLWPPILIWQLPGKPAGPWGAVCWLGGTPLMGVYVTASLLAGRRLRRRRRDSWVEQFGLFLACAWACTGLYLLSLLYWLDIFKND